jgi:hypothetical protein
VFVNKKNIYYILFFKWWGGVSMKKVFLFACLVASSFQTQANIFLCYDLEPDESCISKSEVMERSKMICDSIYYGKDTVAGGITDTLLKEDFLFAYALFEYEKNKNEPLVKFIEKEGGQAEKILRLVKILNMLGLP